jgi:hypothetical protein
VLVYRNRPHGMSYHLNEHLKGRVKVSTDPHPYPAGRDDFTTLPDGAPSPHAGGGTTQGAKLPPTPNAGRQPLREAPLAPNLGVDD